MIIYEKVKINDNEIIKKNNDDETTSWIPIDESNPDYQAYLRWLKNPADTGWTEPTLTKF
jgi:hypothetical protein